MLGSRSRSWRSCVTLARVKQNIRARSAWFRTAPESSSLRNSSARFSRSTIIGGTSGESARSGYLEVGSGKLLKRFLHGNPSGSHAEVKASALLCPGLGPRLTPMQSLQFESIRCAAVWTAGAHLRRAGARGRFAFLGLAAGNAAAVTRTNSQSRSLSSSSSAPITMDGFAPGYALPSSYR